MSSFCSTETLKDEAGNCVLNQLNINQFAEGAEAYHLGVMDLTLEAEMLSSFEN